MSETAASAKNKKQSKAKKKPGIMDRIGAYIQKAINDADEAAAADRVEKLRQAHPDASADELVELLIKQKCLQTGAVGAITSGAATLPGLGTLASLTFGVAADIGMTFKLQAELVLEIAAVYRRELSPTEKRNIIMVVTGLSAGVTQLTAKTGQQIALKASERLAQKSAARAIPILGVAASGGSNILTTYIIGQRAQAYFSLGPEAVGDWGESIRAITGLDERKIIDWLTETTENSWQLVSNSAYEAANAVIVVGQTAGEMIVVGAGKISEAATSTGQGIVNTGKKAGAGIAAGASRVSQAAATTGQGVVSTGKKAGGGISIGVRKVSDQAATTAQKTIGSLKNKKNKKKA